MSDLPTPPAAPADSAHADSRYRKKAVPQSLWRRLLRRGQAALYRRFETLLPPEAGHRVLDLGISASLTDPRDYFFESRYPYPHQIVAAGLEPPDLFRSLFPDIEYVQVERGKPYPFDPDSFDLVFCNAVIEHVGNREVQRRFLADLFRIGRTVFVTTPNRWFPVEVHTVLPFVHWLPTPWYRRIFRGLGFDFFAQEEHLNLLDRRSLEALVPPGAKASIHGMRTFGLTSNLLLVGHRAQEPGELTRSVSPSRSPAEPPG